MSNDEAKQRAKNYMSLKGALEPNQIKCYCGHTSYCDCSPQEEPKQETLEEFALKNSKYTNHSNINHLKEEAIILGAKWQQKRMYSEDEVKKLIVDFLFVRGIGREVENVNDWFKQYKKK
jgi:hypothetical protein